MKILNDLVNVLKTVYFCEEEKGVQGLGLGIYSKPGRGKTSMMDMFTSSHGLLLGRLRLGQMEPEDIKIMVPTKGGKLKHAIHEDIHRLIREEYSVMFLDEFSDADDKLQGYAMDMTLEREIGGIQLHPTCVPILCGNPSHVANQRNTVSCPMSNRMTWINLDALLPTEDTATDWADEYEETGFDGTEELTQVLNPEDEMKRVKKLWGTHDKPGIFREERTKVAQFIRGNRSMLDTLKDGVWNPKCVEDLSFASPRSVARVGRILAASKIHSLDTRMRTALISGTVGANWADTFLQWERDASSLPNAEELLDGGTTWTHDPNRQDVARVLFDSCISVLKKKGVASKLTSKRATAFWSVLSCAVNIDVMGKDMVQPYVTKMCTDLGFFSEPEHVRAGTDLVAALHIVVVGTGK